MYYSFNVSFLIVFLFPQVQSVFFEWSYHSRLKFSFDFVTLLEAVEVNIQLVYNDEDARMGEKVRFS